MSLLSRVVAAFETLAARRPPSVTFRSLPVDTSSDWTVESMRRALTDHEQGSFHQSAQLVDAFGRDERIRGPLHTRTGALLGKSGVGFELQPPEQDKRRGAALVKRVEPWWPQATEQALSRLLSDGILLGVGVATLQWTRTATAWEPRLKTWDAHHVYWDETSERYRTFTSAGTQDITGGDGTWVLYTPYGRRSHLGGAVRALGWPFIARQEIRRDWVRFCFRHGQPMLAVKEPYEAPEPVKRQFFEALKKIGRGAMLRLPQISQGWGFGLELIEAKDTSWESFKAYLEALAADSSIALLGQNLTTEVQGGSHAAALAHLRVRQDLLDSDSETLATVLREQLIVPWGRFNVAGWRDELAPWPHWQTSIPEDRSAQADDIVKVSGAIESFGRSGAPVDIEALLERFDVAIGEPLEAPKESDPKDPENKDQDADADPDQDADPEDKAPEQEEQEASVRLASGDAAKVAQGFVRGQRYADRLADRARDAAARALRPTVDQLLEDIDAAETPEALQALLAERYAAARPSELDLITERAFLLAELAGRYAVIEDL